jgi:hypothetical protein
MESPASAFYLLGSQAFKYLSCGAVFISVGGTNAGQTLQDHAFNLKYIEEWY